MKRDTLRSTGRGKVSFAKTATTQTEISMDFTIAVSTMWRKRTRQLAEGINQKTKRGEKVADILIRGMDMPTHCDDCTFYDGIFCAWTGYYIYYPEEKLEECPLIEVPDHGRLIDADELRSEYKEPMDWLDRTQVTYHVTGIWASIDAAPTVIPAFRKE